MPIEKRARGVLLFIVGPTAIGKTALAVKLAGRIKGEVISADSMQVYKGMRILSQSPGPSEKGGVRHYLAGVVGPGKEYSVASFCKAASSKARSILKRGKIPIIAGGSGLYVKALIDGLFPSPPADVRFRSSMRRFIAANGSGKLHKKLSKIDPEAAAGIHPNDARRIIRALEVYHSTGRTMTELKRGTKGLSGRFDIKIFALTAPRERIYSNINSRVDRMFADGAVAEVIRLRKKSLSKTAKAVLGFKEICGYLDGEYDIDEAKELVKINTRHFAKRQLTWFRADPRIEWFDVSRIKEDKIIKNMINRSER